MRYRTLVVVHGKSEYEFCKGIASNYRLSIEYDHENRGENCIQIRQLEERFSSGHFRSENALHKKFEDLEYLGRNEIKMLHLRIFPIMDTDDSPRDATSYRTNNMFNSSTFKDRITPIFNTPDLDTVLRKCGFKINSNDKIGSYGRLVNEYELQELISALDNRNDTNITVFLKYCSDLAFGPQN